MPDIVSPASDLKKLPLSIESRVVALTLVKLAPDPLNNVAVAVPFIETFPVISVPPDSPTITNFSAPLPPL